MNTIEFDKNVICNSKFVAIRILDNLDNLKIGNIYMSSTAKANERLAFGKIESVGPIAKDKYGLEIGQYVMFDRLATFFHTAPVALLEYNNVICLTNADKNEFHPLKGMVFVKPDAKSRIENVKGIYVQDYDAKLNTATIIDTNFTSDAIKFDVGTKVLMVKGGDEVTIGNEILHIYKQDMIICSMED